MTETTRSGVVRRRALLGLGAAGITAAGLALKDPSDSVFLGQDATRLFGMLADERLTYAHLEGRAGRVDVYRPSGPGPFPVIVWNGGSGWLRDTGYEEGYDVARGLVPAGYAVAAVSVRSSKQAVFPAQVVDLTEAVRWVREHAGEFDLDPGRIAVGGSSSGGWNALMAGLTGGRDLDRAHPRPPGEEVPEGGHAIPPEDAVQAIVDFFGPVDFYSMRHQMLPGACEDLNRRQGLTQCHSDENSTKSLMLGAPILTRPDLVRLAAPRSHVTAQSPPTLVVHGLEDREVPWEQSRMLFDTLVAHGVRSAFYSVPGEGHDMGMVKRKDGQAQVKRNDVPRVAVHLRISWSAVASFLDEVMPAAEAAAD